MKVFIENEAGSDKKNIYDEKTLKFKKTVSVSREYPFPYGFIIDTTSGDGDNLDVFVITKEKLRRGQIVECELVGLMEQIETSWDKSKGNIEEEDHNILAILPGKKVKLNYSIREKLRDFIGHVFDHVPNKKIQVGEFLNQDEAFRYIEKCRD